MQTMSPTRRQARSPQPVGKISWHGVILSRQPRIRLLRPFDQRSHSYLGYELHLPGTIDDEKLFRNPPGRVSPMRWTKRTTRSKH